MLFNSFPFLLGFLPVVVVGAYLVRDWFGVRMVQAWVLLASVVFYGWNKPSHLPFLFGSIVVNFLLARRIAASGQPRRKLLLQLGLVLNISYLCYFKYTSFLLRNFRYFFHSGFDVREHSFPLGISFFTITQIAYLVDVYQEALPAMGLLDASTFVSFFPYVISGPIPRANRMQAQFGDFGGKTGRRHELLTRGIYLFSLGLAKKVLFAFVFTPIAGAVFDTHAAVSALEVWIGVFAYTLQLYFDFSGYSDMAMGAAMMLGIEIPRNFDAPLRSKSLIEFWERWHISLSEFITTYLFTPVIKAMPKATLGRVMVTVFIVMVIAGFWHGPAWTFVIYGAVHGAGLAINRYWRKKKLAKLPAFLSWALTFTVVLLSFLIFRAASMRTALHLMAAMVNVHHLAGFDNVKPALQGLTVISRLVLLPAGIVAAFYGRSTDDLRQRFQPSFANALLVTGAIVASFAFSVFNDAPDFLYFKF